MDTKAIVFDLGGTLIEYTGNYSSWPDLETPGFLAAYNYLKQKDTSVPDFDRFKLTGFDLLPKRWRMATSGQRNLTVASLLGDIFATFNIAGPEKVLLEAASREYERAVCADARPIPNGRFIVSHLHSLGLKIGLVSNTMFSGEIHRDDLARFDMLGFFDALLFSADANKWKPDPDAFLSVLNQLDVEPSAAVFVGDDPAADIIGGNRAGMHTVYFLSSQRFPSPDGIKPDLTIAELVDLPEAIGTI